MKEPNFETFMFIYMYELENYLLSKKDELQSITFQSDEANTDRPLKEFLKNIIESDFNCIPQKDNANLFLTINNNIVKYSYDLFYDYKITNVLLRESLNDELKEEIKKSKNSIYTNPDIYLEIKNNNVVTYISVELKSTKNDSIPGSSIQQINPDEWVIFIKHTNSTVEIVTGQYINAINSKIEFPDRSPRPQVSFKELLEWNNTHRTQQIGNLQYENNDDEEIEKMNLLADWQRVLADRWLNVLFSNEKKKKEPWFSNNLRKFILMFLEKYDSFNEEERKKFKEIVESLIEYSEE